MRPLVLISTIVLLAGAAGGQSSQPPTKKMETPVEQKLRAVIQDVKHPGKTEIDAGRKLLQSGKQKGIWILAPETMALDHDDEVQVLGWDYYDAKPRGYRYINSSGVVVATRIESRETVAALVTWPKEPADSKPSAPPEPIVEDYENLITFRLLLRDRLPDLPWRAGTYLIDVLLDGQESNRIQFQLTPGLSVERDPAIAEYIERQRGTAVGPKTLIPPMVEGRPYPNYRKTPASPMVPQDIGIKLVAERVTVYTPEAQNILRGSFRLPIPAGFYRAGDHNSPTAAVPITLVITGNDLVGPFVVPLRTATYDPIDEKSPESIVTGFFAVDLFALPETSKVVQTYSIWAYSGAVRSERVLAAVITPNMLK
jgi:hypothetical protein